MFMEHLRDGRAGFHLSGVDRKTPGARNHRSVYGRSTLRVRSPKLGCRKFFVDKVK
jgi:hypothetical protein